MEDEVASMRPIQFGIANLLVLTTICAFVTSGYVRGGAETAYFALISYTSLGIGVQYLYCALKDRDVEYLWGSLYIGGGIVRLWLIYGIR